jgi:hypothetical protein
VPNCHAGRHERENIAAKWLPPASISDTSRSRCICPSQDAFKAQSPHNAIQESGSSPVASGLDGRAAGRRTPANEGNQVSVISKAISLVRDVRGKLNAIVSGLDSQSQLPDRNMRSVIQGMDNQSRMLAERLDRIVQGLDNQSRLIDERLQDLIQRLDRAATDSSPARASQSETAVLNATQRPTEKTAHIYKEIPDYVSGTLRPDQFRDLLLGRGAVMLRRAVDPLLLDRIKQKIDGIFVEYESAPEARQGTHPANAPPIDYDNFWNQLKRSHIFDNDFRKLSGLSYYDIIRTGGLWDLAARAFPECNITESADCNCRRTTIGDLPIFFDAPLDFHVDAQYHFIHQLSINFWTPLSACGEDAPGLKVVLLGVDQTKEYLEFNPSGYDPEPNDIDNMRHFRCHKEGLAELKTSGLSGRVWTPAFEKGDVLAFTNFTMHATHLLPGMTKPRTSVEVRISLPKMVN